MKRPYPSSTSTTRRVERRLLPLPGSIPRMAMAVCVALGGRRCAYAFIGYSGGATPAAAAVGGSLRRMGQSPMSLKTAVLTATAARYGSCRNEKTIFTGSRLRHYWVTPLLNWRGRHGVISLNRRAAIHSLTKGIPGDEQRV